MAMSHGRELWFDTDLGDECSFIGGLAHESAVNRAKSLIAL